MTDRRCIQFYSRGVRRFVSIMKMQHGAARSRATSSSTASDDWHSVQLRSHKSCRARCGPDALGLANIVDPFTFLARKPSQNSDQRGVNSSNQQNPRRRKLRAAGGSVSQVAEVFSPQKSLRLAKLPLITAKKSVHVQSNQCVTRTPMQIVSPQELELPVHELIQTMDDAVKADPLAELNQSAIARLFMDQWLQQFEADRRSFKSVAVRYEVGFEELQRRTVNLPRPNELITTFCCKVLEDLTPHFGPYAPLFRVLSAEFIQSIYARDGLPYFALVNHHKRLLLTLRKDKEWREERNEVLADDIENVYSTFRHFLSECTYALSRLHLHEWYSIVVVQKKNNRKYVAYFSNWFSSAPKAILRKVYVAWKREAALHRVDNIHKQMQVDLQALTVVKRLSEELTKQRDIAQADSLVMRNGRKHAEEWAKSLELRIKATSAYLDTSRRREAQVCQEGQLRVEAVACLPPLILESLLRGYHGVGFLQQASVPGTDSDLQAPEVSLVLLECMAEISRLQNSLLKRKSTLSMQGGRSNSVVGRSNSVVIGLPSIENIEQPLSPQAAIIAAATTTGNLIGRRAGGAVSQDELSGRAFAKLFTSLRERIQTCDVKVLFTQLQDFTTDKQWSQHENAPLAQEYQQLLRAIRYQDEHYASHSKLFSSRMLESHEISLVPNQSMPNVTDELAGSDKGDLGVINGAKRFWKPIIPVQKPKSPPSRSQLRRMPTRTQSMMFLKERPQSPPLLLENLSLIDEADFDISSLHSRGFSILLLAHFATEYGALLFSPADMSAFTHNAYMNPPAEKVKAEDAPSPAQSSTSLPPADESIPASDAPTEISNSLRIIQPIVTAYNTWNEISEQLISAGVVQSRGLSSCSVTDPSHESSGDPPEAQRTALATPIRPMLKHQFEPLSHSSFLAPAREKNGRRTSFTTSDGNTYHSARIRHLTAEGADKLAQSIDAIHKSVKATTDKVKDFRVTRHHLRDLRGTQWQQATELALELAAKQKEASGPVVANANGGDHREHVYECISLVNSTMRRIFSVEENPEMELSSVTDVFEKHQRVVRQLYTPFRSNIKHAMSLDDLWHIVKIVRLPREIHVLPILRDEELVANGYEQLFPPEDLAELFLQLCNEQFQPQIAPLSSRVEYFITHHLTIALQNQSLLRPLMHRSDVKLAINSHSQTIRIIFRRYCAKERELMMPAVGATKPKPRHTGHGITKYMRMVDWQAFAQDYHLIRARLSMEQALAVFRNVQEAPPGSDDQLELIYSEFCEALVGVATFYFPNPFIKTASKVTQFFRRYLPLSPEDAHDHA